MARKKKVAKPVGVELKDFTDADVARIRELVAEGMTAGHYERGWEHELEVIHHVRGRVRDSVHVFIIEARTVDDAVQAELDSSVPFGEPGIGGVVVTPLDGRHNPRFCMDCSGLIHGRLHVVGDRYAVGCL